LLVTLHILCLKFDDIRHAAEGDSVLLIKSQMNESDIESDRI